MKQLRVEPVLHDMLHLVQRAWNAGNAAFLPLRLPLSALNRTGDRRCMRGCHSQSEGLARPLMLSQTEWTEHSWIWL